MKRLTPWLLVIALWVCFLILCYGASSCTKDVDKTYCYECIMNDGTGGRDWHPAGCYTDAQFDTLKIENKWSCRKK